MLLNPKQKHATNKFIFYVSSCCSYCTCIWVFITYICSADYSSKVSVFYASNQLFETPYSVSKGLEIGIGKIGFSTFFAETKWTSYLIILLLSFNIELKKGKFLLCPSVLPAIAKAVLNSSKFRTQYDFVKNNKFEIISIRNSQTYQRDIYILLKIIISSQRFRVTHKYIHWLIYEANCHPFGYKLA